MCDMTRPSLTAWHAWSFLPERDEWTDYVKFSPDNIAKAPTLPGTYVLGLPGGRPIGRLLGTDRIGVLDVGESKDLRKRLSDLYRCASTAGQTGHMAGWRLGSLGLLSRLGVEIDKLRIFWRETETEDQAYRLEGRILRTYYELFGELPPLNYQFNWSTYEP